MTRSEVRGHAKPFCYSRRDLDFGLLMQSRKRIDCGSWGEVNQNNPAAKQILAYFLRNPSAADSLEGIATWRLLEEAIHRNVYETEEALQWLVSHGYLLESVHAHSGRLFRLNAEKQIEAVSLLEFREQMEPSASNSGEGVI
jgi:hypothetical protein